MHLPVMLLFIIKQCLTIQFLISLLNIVTILCSVVNFVTNVITKVC